MKKLLELGNAVRPFELSQGGDQYYEYTFSTSSGALYEVRFSGAQVDAEDLIEFFPATSEDPNVNPLRAMEHGLEKGSEWVPKLKDAQSFFPMIVAYDLIFSLTSVDDEGCRDHNYTVTNKGGRDSLEVFATVQKIVSSFLETCDDYDAITFSAAEKSRQKLYDHFADAIEKHLGFAQIRGEGWVHNEKEYVLFDPAILDEV